ncbi:MAG TPA: hypothetical protein VE955_06290 [Candidatus Dormibacteraeota bacterium]|nr:hypothetical protein [Candidatus Dormibacteraeota bacterium]
MVEDRYGRIRPAKFRKFVEVWRSLPRIGLELHVWTCRFGEQYKTQDNVTPKFCPQHGSVELSYFGQEIVGQAYLLHQIAQAIGVDEDTVQKYVELVAGADLDGKPWPYRMGTHSAVFKDPDPEDHLMGPLGEVTFLAIDDVHAPERINESSQFEVKVSVDYSTTSSVPTAVTIVDQVAGGTQLGAVEDVIVGRGTRTYSFLLEGPSIAGECRLMARTYRLDLLSNTWLPTDERAITLTASHEEVNPIGLVAAGLVLLTAVTAPFWGPKLVDAFSN